MSVPPELMNAMPGADLSGLPAPAPKPAAPRKPTGMQPSRYAKPPMTAATAASEMGGEAEKDMMSDLQQYRGDINKEREAYQQYGKTLDENPPEMPKTFQEQAPQYADFAKQVSPLLMIATVLGGKAMGISAQGMLGAVTGMVNGTAEGNQQNYQQAYQNYQDHYARFKEEEANRVAYRDKMLEWYKGRIDAPQKAAQASLALMNADEKVVNTGINGDKALSQLHEKLVKAQFDAQELHLKTMRDQAKVSAAATKELNKELKAISGLEQAASRLKNANQQVQSAWSKLEAAAKQDSSLQDFIDGRAVLDSSFLKRLMPVSKQAIAEFNAAAGQAIGPALREINQGLPAAALRAVRVEYAEMDALPSLDKGWNSAKEAVKALQTRTEDASNYVPHRKMEVLRNAQSSGNPYYSQEEADAARGGAAPSVAPQGGGRPAGAPENAKQAPDGNWYAPDPNRSGKYLKY